MVIKQQQISGLIGDILGIFVIKYPLIGGTQKSGFKSTFVGGLHHKIHEKGSQKNLDNDI